MDEYKLTDEDREHLTLARERARTDKAIPWNEATRLIDMSDEDYAAFRREYQRDPNREGAPPGEEG